ncbi:MAG: glycoside hydrolase family 9 protein [Cyclobacteriaceae bacterium]|nr:glycoside hydrolase family 9 protein [Cyclobacteriaceae bacterium]
MKKLLILLLATANFYYCAPKKTAGPDSPQIRINQLGYFTNGPKKFIVADAAATSFDIIDMDGKTVFSGKLEPKGNWDKSGEAVSLGDFSTFVQEGQYRIALDNGISSYQFEIGMDVFDSVKVATMKCFYLHRISEPIEEKHAGVYKRPLGHEDLQLAFHPSTGKTSGTLDTPGGWYDAGDYGKYTINTGITVAMMLATYEKYPAAYPDGSLNIPESGNGVPDILDEAKVAIDWMLTMQDDDGGVFVKVTPLSFDGFVMPENSKKDRVVIGKSTAAALHLAAVGAMVGRIYKPIDAEYAQKLLAAAVRAWQWAQANPEVYYAKNPDDVSTGAYSDVRLEEEFFWAAAELFITTGGGEYLQKIQPKLGGIKFRLEENWCNYLDNLGYYSLLGASSPLDEAGKKQVADGLIKLADSLSLAHQAIPYQIPVDHFIWGSSSDVLDGAMIFANAYDVTKDHKYLDRAVESFDYILGKNATGYSMITGFGSKQVMNIHHRPSAADSIAAPYPGFVVGGPNFRLQDKGSLDAAGLHYASELPAKSYIDVVESYASNEICINWNAPCIYMLGFFDHYKSRP